MISVKRPIAKPYINGEPQVEAKPKTLQSKAWLAPDATVSSEIECNVPASRITASNV